MTLPPLPEPKFPAARVGMGSGYRVWTGPEMKAYATASVLAEREACAAMFDTTLNGEAEHYWREAAAAIRARKDKE